jgi:RNA-directed DNA polymerase
MLWRWSRRRHKNENKNADWVKNKYFRKVDNREWIFADKPDHTLFSASTITCDLVSYAKVKGNASPFDPSLNESWLKRYGKIPQEA